MLLVNFMQYFFFCCISKNLAAAVDLRCYWPYGTSTILSYCNVYSITSELFHNTGLLPNTLFTHDKTCALAQWPMGDQGRGGGGGGRDMGPEATMISHRSYCTLSLDKCSCLDRVGYHAFFLLKIRLWEDCFTNIIVFFGVVTGINGFEVSQEFKTI